MELAYILIAAAVIILPFVLTRLFSGKWGEPRTAHGMKPSRDDEVRALKEAELVAMAAAMRKTAERRANESNAQAIATTEAPEVKVHAKPMRDAGLMATLKTAQETSQEVQKLVAKGRKVEAIKILREKSGLGLKEAKDLVDRLG
jgi:ribosomal protein L7/L12